MVHAFMIDVAGDHGPQRGMAGSLQNIHYIIKLSDVKRGVSVV